MREHFEWIRRLIGAILISSLVSGAAFAQPTNSPNTTKTNTIYTELATSVLTGSASLNYEHLLTHNFSIRLGYGFGYYGSARGITTADGPLSMVYYSFSASNSKAEIGLGGSLMNKRDGIPRSDISFLAGTGWRISPSIALGYRYQQFEGGFFFRIGITYAYLFGGPIQISLGHTF